MDLPRTFKGKLAPRLRNIVVYRVFEQAEKEKRDVALPKDLLLSIIDDEKTFGCHIIKAFNIDMQQFVINIKNDNPIFQKPKENKKYHDSFFQLMKIAEKVMLEMQVMQVGTEHVILAFLRYYGKSKHISDYKEIFENHGIEYEKFYEGVISIANHIEKNDSEEDAEQPKNKVDKKIAKRKDLKRKNPSTNNSSNTNNSPKSLLDQNLIRNLNKAVFKKEEKIIGRKDQILQCVRILCRKKKSNPIIIGETGVGKTSLVEGIAQSIIEQEVPEKLSNSTIYEISLGNIIAGTKYRGQFEEKMMNVVEFLSTETENPLEKIAFIDEIHHLIKAGSADGSVDASFILKPKLADGTFRCIGTTTYDEYRKFILADSALSRRFRPVFLEEPSIEQTIDILNQVKNEYEEFHGVKISENIVNRCVELSATYIKDRFFPDKAFDILDEACAQTVIERRIEEKDIIEINVSTIEQVISNITNIPLTTVSGSEKTKLSELQENIEKEVVGQNLAVTSICNSIKRSRLGFKDKDKPMGCYLFIGRTGVGKCHGKGTKILMHDGKIKNVEKIKVGDVIMGDDSGPRNVLSICCGEEQMYRVTPNKGESFTCNESHILSLKNTLTKQTINISIKEYIESSKKFKHLHKLYRVPVYFSEKKLEIYPYFMGLWIGDGTCDSASITTADKEIVDFLYKYASKNNLFISKKEQKDNKSSIYRIVSENKSRGNTCKNNIFLQMKKEGTLKNYRSSDIYEKKINEKYLINSEKNRLELLAGIVDSDGHLTNNCYEIVTKYKNLKDQIEFLGRSLGFCVTSSEKIVKEKTYYRLHISGDIINIPVKITRKKPSERKQKKDVLVSGFKLEKIQDNKYYGFNLDGNHLYLLKDFTVTHNTLLAKKISEYLFGPDKIIRLDMSEYMEKHSVSKIIGCFLPGSTVGMKGGFVKNIEDVKIGDIVISHSGKYKIVEDTHKYEYNGEIVNLRCSNIKEDLKLTPGHEVLAIKTPKGTKRFKNFYDKNKLEWIEAKKLEKDDIVVIPKNKKFNHITKKIDLWNYCKNLPKFKKDDNHVWCYNDHKIKRFINIDKDFCRLAGYYVAEGCCDKNNKNVKLTFNIKEKTYIDEVQNLFVRIFEYSKNIRIKNDEKNNKSFVIIFSRVLSIFFKNFFGEDVYNKKIPDFFTDLNKKLLHCFITTVIFGDGSNTTKRRIQYDTVSKQLYYQINFILNKLGVITNCQKFKSKDRRGYETSLHYRIYISGSQIERLSNTIPELDIKLGGVKNTKIQRKSFSDDDYIYIRLDDVKKEKYNGFVYDLSVEEDTSYCVGRIAVHNSPPGYIGYDSGGQLTEKIKTKPYSVLLFDEIEKAHPEVVNILLQILDEGRLTDSFGRVADFRNCIIIMTSNLATSKLDNINKNIGFNIESKEQTVEEMEKFLKGQTEKHFPPEFINRLDDIIVFGQFKKEDVEKIFDLELKKSLARLAESGYSVELSDSMKDHIKSEGYSEKYGARPMSRAIGRLLEVPLANAYFSGLINGDQVIVVDYKDEEVHFSNKKGK